MLLQIHFVYLLLPFCTLNVQQMHQSDVIMYGDISLLTLNIFFILVLNALFIKSILFLMVLISIFSMNDSLHSFNFNYSIAL